MPDDQDSLTSDDWNSLRSHLLRFAAIQLNGHPDAAEDAVQETLLAAYAHRSRFEGRAQFQTWAFAILKNKITDVLRSRKYHIPFTALPQDDGLDEAFSEQFNPDGSWRSDTLLTDWNSPEHLLNGRQFGEILQACLYRLPEHTARVFMMREILELDAREIQEHCGLSANHYHVIMHRAREGLRRCLQIKWFGQEKTQ